ncbi:hypothetical protein WA158_001480 [Blastocystis sp. Blastoise]
MNTLILAFLLFITLTQALECRSPNLRLFIKRTYKTLAAEEVIEIYEGDATGSSLYQFDGVGFDNKEATYELCLAPKKHTFVALDGNNDGWVDGSFFVLTTNGGVTILKGTLDRYTREEWTFYPHYTVALSSSWKYYNKNLDGINWKDSTYDDTEWISYTAGHFPPVSTMTRYYRYTGILPSNLDEFVIYELGMYNKEGIIVYINGQEIYRQNINVSNPSFITPASILDDYVVTRRMTSSFPSWMLTMTQVIISVEVHSHQSIIPLSDPFDFYFIPIYGPCNTRTQDGTVSSSSTISQFPAVNAFDGDIQTTWQFTSPSTIEYNYPERRLELINSYTVYNGKTSSSYDPKSWKLMASNDKVNYILLDYQTDLHFEALGTPLTFNLYASTVSYTYYKLEILSLNGSPTGEIGEIFLNVCLQPIVDPLVLTYPEVKYNLITYMSEVYIRPLSNGFTNFSVSPSLPDGLTITPENGLIQGIPTTISSTPLLITITATSSRQTPGSSSITFIITSCDYPNVRLDIHKMNSNLGTGALESFSLFDNNNELIDTQIGMNSDYVEIYTQTYKYCIPSGIYSITLESTDSFGWARGSTLDVTIPSATTATTSTTTSTYTIARKSLLYTKKESFSFSTLFLSPISLTSYTPSTSVPDITWLFSSQEPQGFTNYTTPSTPTTSRIWLYRIHYSTSPSKLIHSYEFSFKARAGALIFVDGKPFFKANLNSWEFTLNTVPIKGKESSEPSEWFYYTGCISTLSEGQHLFAVALIQKEGYTPIIEDFECKLRLLIESVSISRTWNMNAEHSNTVSGDETAAYHIFEQNYYTRYIGYLNPSYPAPQYITSSFQENRAETMNAYCIVNGFDHPDYDPISWVIEGSLDKQTFKELDREVNIKWTARSQKQCYYLFNQTVPYNYYRLSFLQAATSFPTNDKVSISELEFYIYDYARMSISDLSYSSLHLYGYINTDLSSVFPNHELWNNFDITPSLPLGLTIDTGTGVISGIPKDTLDQSYTISALGPQGLSRCTLIITITTCSLPKALFKIYFEGMGQNSYQNGFELRNANNIKQDSYPNFPAYLERWSITYCVDAGIYNLVMLDSRGDGWDTGMYSIYGEENNIIATGTVIYGERSKVIRFNSGYLIYSDTNIWKYTNVNQHFDDSWKNAYYSDSDWSEAKSDHFIGLSGITQYYRSSVKIPYLGRYSSWELRVRYQAGIVIYIDSTIIYINHMPSIYTESTYATMTSSSPIIAYTSGSTQTSLLVAGTSIIAVEIHNAEDHGIDTSFRFSLKIHPDNHEGIVDGYVSTSHPGYKDDYYIETEDKAFDGKTSTKYFGVSTCKDQWLQWTYNNNRKEYINSWSFARGSMANRVPSELTLLGSNDNGTQWKILYWSKNVTFGDILSLDSVRRFSFYNLEAYNSYRILMNGYCTEGFEVSEIQFYTKFIGSYCTAIDGYEPQLEGEYSYLECPGGYNGYRYRLCSQLQFQEEINECVLRTPVSIYYEHAYIYKAMAYMSFTPTIVAAEYNMTITPSLPAGLFFSYKDGTISGMPLLPNDITEYTVTIANRLGSISTTFSLTIDKPSQTSLIVAIVICIILLVVIIGLVVLCVIFTKRREQASKQRKQKKLDTNIMKKSLL